MSQHGPVCLCDACTDRYNRNVPSRSIHCTDGDHEEIVANWRAECAEKGWDPDTGAELGPDSAPSPWVDDLEEENAQRERDELDELSADY